MNYKSLYFIIMLFSCKTLYSQSSFIPSGCYHPNFKLDTSSIENNKWSYIAKQTDSLFLEEIINLTRYETKLKSKEYEKHFKGKQETLGKLNGIFYTEVLNKGTSNNKIYFDYIYYTDFGIISLNYNRDYYYIKEKNKVYVYTFSYVAKIPRNWSSNEKWELSIPHFLEKIRSVKHMYNGCKIFD